MLELSEERLVELVKRIKILDHEEQRNGLMSLELGTREGQKTGYPQLTLHQYQGLFTLFVTIPSDTYGYDTHREMTIEEMVTFVRVAKKKAPNERLTKELIKKVNSYLTEKQTEITRAIELIS
jgi:hypothetical protein